ncbi:restriction endonuclease subunit S [Lysinibacillus boronitolerans]|uniref:restriction endonuclease subunit S n=1 Tax=Lysinibacillus boronitolerans TaxID=309788 RepID=UPI003851F910
MENFKSYQIYIDSGIKWIGLIPKHWKVTKYKRLFNFINGNGFPERFQGKNEGEFPFYKVSDINFRGKMITSAINYVSLDDLKENKWNIVKPNSILTAKIGEALKKNHRKINQKNCLIDNNMMALSLNKGSLDYYYYFLSIVDMDWYSNPGTVPSINMRNLREDNLLIPSLEEQDQIAKFLNIKVSQIDDLIVDKEKLIELLEEKRQAIITEAVTKGLNPNVKMKDSGVEWIGEIPEHWEMNKLKYLVYLRNEKVVENYTLPYVGLENIESKTGNYSPSLGIEEQLVEGTSSAFYSGDVLFGKLRPYLAKCFVANFKGKCTTELLVMKTKENIILSEYLKFLLLTDIYIQVINSSTYGAKMPRANWDFISNLLIPLPNIKEQMEIIKKVKNEITTIDELREELKMQIEKLKEYRQSLIYEAVTGKIDVREYKKVLS